MRYAPGGGYADTEQMAASAWLSRKQPNQQSGWAVKKLNFQKQIWPLFKKPTKVKQSCWTDKHETIIVAFVTWDLRGKREKGQ